MLQTHLSCTTAAALQALTTLHMILLLRLSILRSCSSCAGALSCWILPAQTCLSTLPAAPWLRPSLQDRCTSPPFSHAPLMSGLKGCCLRYVCVSLPTLM